MLNEAASWWCDDNKFSGVNETIEITHRKVTTASTVSTGNAQKVGTHTEHRFIRWQILPDSISTRREAMMSFGRDTN